MQCTMKSKTRRNILKQIVAYDVTMYQDGLQKCALTYTKNIYPNPLVPCWFILLLREKGQACDFFFIYLLGNCKLGIKIYKSHQSVKIRLLLNSA